MLDEQVVSAVAIGNLKAISEQPAMLSNLAYSNVVTTNNLGQQNAVANQRAVGELGLPLVAKATNTIGNIGPLEARSAVDVLTNNELAQTIADLKGVLQAFAGSPGGKLPKDLLKELKALLEQGLELKDGVLIVPESVREIVIPGSLAKEDISIAIESQRTVIKVRRR
ncbi:hypothetical protein M4R22_14690 [Acidovorax sp. GBBC 3334]|uniref:hypothetical protein n=1 Tax=unclassified Acidovorax TaxID=2684926 RepID=UPI002302CC5C|nr:MULTISPECIES: hypothetical protein [unclassified Acidovorax]MDA8456016.1 hypothetical protein [Acidovorax sp. GBBC 3334]MDA8523664.1 hypothetical protein [Acidovorax sp. NCPPB 4044]